MVELLHVTQWHIQEGHLMLDVPQTPEFQVELGACQAGHQFLIDFSQDGIPEVDLPPCAPAHQRRGGPEQGHHQHDQGNEHHLDTIGQRGQPEGKEALEDRLAGSVEALGVLADGEVAIGLGGEFTRFGEFVPSAMDAGSGCEQERDEGRVEILADSQHGGRS